MPKYLKYRTFEEKETDVNIAVKMLEQATLNQCDKFYILSGDSDFLPAIKSVRKNFRDIKLINILPINGRGISLGQVCDEQRMVSEDDLKNSFLKDTIKIGKKTIKKPTSWN